MPRKTWEDGEYLITLYLYRYGYEELGMNYTEIANIMGRTPDSILMRFANYLAVENGKTGLKGGGEKAREMYLKYINLPKAELHREVICSLINMAKERGA